MASPTQPMGGLHSYRLRVQGTPQMLAFLSLFGWYGLREAFGHSGHIHLTFHHLTSFSVSCSLPLYSHFLTQVSLSPVLLGHHITSMPSAA